MSQKRYLPKNVPATFVEWEDAASPTGGWNDHSIIEEAGLITVVSVGFKVKETKDYITLAQNIHNDGISEMISIPKKCIKKRRLLSGKK
jgi:hypothetical protein